MVPAYQKQLDQKYSRLLLTRHTSDKTHWIPHSITTCIFPSDV